MIGALKQIVRIVFCIFGIQSLYSTHWIRHSNLPDNYCMLVLHSKSMWVANNNKQLFLERLQTLK